jgi:hypothetical protein
MFLVGDIKTVQYPAAHCADPTFGVGVHCGAARADAHDFDAFGLQRGIEVGSECAVETADYATGFDDLRDCTAFRIVG